MIVTDRWRRALREILARADITGADLAAEVGLARMSVSRYLRDKTRPDPVTARRINEKVAKLAHVPEAREYLDALALIDGLISPDKELLGRALAATRIALGSVEQYFVSPKAASAVLQAAIDGGSFDEAQVILLSVALAGMRGKRLMSKLDGRQSRDLYVDEITWLFEQAGVSLDIVLRTDPASKARRIRDRFEISADNALSRLAPADRLQALETVLKAYDVATQADSR